VYCQAHAYNVALDEWNKSAKWQAAQAGTGPSGQKDPIGMQIQDATNLLAAAESAAVQREVVR
jgi:hypothetical protein